MCPTPLPRHAGLVLSSTEPVVVGRSDRRVGLSSWPTENSAAHGACYGLGASAGGRQCPTEIQNNSGHLSAAAVPI
jgi:hypothetical protein